MIGLLLSLLQPVAPPAHPLLPSLAWVAPGPFVMGADEGEEDTRPAHTVFVGGYFIGVHEVTQEQYARFVRATGRRPPGARDSLPRLVTPERAEAFRRLLAAYAWKDGAPPLGKERHPVVLVTWEDAKAYCDWLSAQTGEAVRLPTEAEWEKAARGGLARARYPWGDEGPAGRASYLPDAALKESRGTEEVGRYRTNALGLHDMAGNAWEWVADFYGPYVQQDARDPRGPARGDRIVRGGAWLDTDPALLAVTHRHEVPPDTWSYSIGFRIALTPPRR
jgi:formylglycine-generating enzyme required for sulfatase activity